jgi:hypothetical protein
MQEMLHLLMETAHELLRAFKGETYQINYDVGFQLEDALTEHTSGVLSRPVRSHLPHEAPSGMSFIWFTLGTRNIDHFVLCPDETRHKVGSNVSTSSDDDNAHLVLQATLLIDVKHRFHSYLSTLSEGRERRMAEAILMRRKQYILKLPRSLSTLPVMQALRAVLKRRKSVSAMQSLLIKTCADWRSTMKI